MSNADQPARLRIMIASSVYGYETELQQISGVLDGYNYEVWNSHMGSIQNHPAKSNLENCLESVRRCDLFLGIVRPFYGTGVVGDYSITHEEMRLAVTLRKPRWFLVHEHVTYTRQLLRQFLFRKDGKPRKRPLRFKKTPVFDDLRVLDMYDDIVQSSVPIAQRVGHWAQDFRHLDQVIAYLQTQFSDVERVRRIVEEMKTP